MKNKIPGESNEQYQGRMYKETVEDQIINDMLSNKVTMILDTDAVVNSTYTKSTPAQKEAYNLLVFQFFSNQYENDMKNHPRMKELVGDFPNYIKMKNIDDEILDRLRTEANIPLGSIENLWNNVFDQDTALLKIAGLNGFKTKLEHTGSDPVSESSVMSNMPLSSIIGNVNAMVENLSKNQLVKNLKTSYEEGVEEVGQQYGTATGVIEKPSTNVLKNR